MQRLRTGGGVVSEGWGGQCRLCGHPASYHGTTFCMVAAGGTEKRSCDCTGWPTEPRCDCGWIVGNHNHDARMGRAERGVAQVIERIADSPARGDFRPPLEDEPSS